MNQSPMTFTRGTRPNILNKYVGKILCRAFDVYNLVLFALFYARQEDLGNTESHLEATSVYALKTWIARVLS